MKSLALIPLIHGLPMNPKKVSDADITQMGWEVYPEGLYRSIKQFAAYPGVRKIIVTENGAGFDDVVTNGEVHDVKRIQYIKNYLKQVLRAKREGIKVDGYFIWTGQE